MPQIVKFCIVGAVAACVHLLSLSLLVHCYDLTPSLANAMAFILAFVVSYWGQSQWTFQNTSQKTSWQSILRFFCVQVLCSFVLNQSGFFLLNSILGWHYFLASTLILMIVPVCTYVLSKFFVFKS